MRRLMIGILVLAGLAIAGAFASQRPLGQAMYERAAGQRLAANSAEFGPGLTLALCGTGSPLPNPDRAGACNLIVAGHHAFLVDAGEGAARNLSLMGIDPGRIDAVLLTHFHSDHIDGLGLVALLHWSGATARAPLTLIGPAGVESVAEGFNRTYSLDHGFRVAHHGERILPDSGGGLRAQPFATPLKPTVVFARDGLTVTAFPVDHRPVEPAVGYRFDYRGRSVVISGDTAQSRSVERAARGADLLVHDALQPRMVRALTAALAKNGRDQTAQITRDILNYHASPEQAADSARRAGVRHLVLSHIVPPLPGRFFYPAFLGGAADRFAGPITVGEDGMVFHLPPQSTAIEKGERL